jgi:glycosyltransferase involved in cell wall biosynthesis
MIMTGDKSSKIRVLRIIARMNIGGPAIQVTTLMNYLPKSEICQLLITGECEEGEEDYLEFNRIDLDRTRIPSLGRSINPISDVKALFKIRKAIKIFRPDIVHTHTFKAGLLGRLAALSIRNHPYLVHTFHGHILNGYLRGAKLAILKTIERFLALKTDVLVAVGERVMEELKEVGVGKCNKFEVVPPGFPMTKVHAISTNMFSSNPEKLKCAWIGRFVEVKAPERILEVARIISENKSQVQFLVAGDGPLRIKIQEQCELEGLPVKFFGWTADIQNFLKDVDLLFLTSINEGTPIAIIESQRLGKPVIATDVGSVSETISHGKSGYAIDYDPPRFAQILESFANDRIKLKEFSRESIRFSGDKFSPERLSSDYLRIYKSLIST